MPAFAFDKVLKIIQTLLAILQFALTAFGYKPDSDPSDA